jgi:hypothetical protein
MEIVSKLIKIFLIHHRFVQVACTVLEMKTVYLIQYQFLVQKDEFMTVRVINMLYALLLGLWWWGWIWWKGMHIWLGWKWMLFTTINPNSRMRWWLIKWWKWRLNLKTITRFIYSSIYPNCFLMSRCSWWIIIRNLSIASYHCSSSTFTYSIISNFRRTCLSIKQIIRYLSQN